MKKYELTNSTIEHEGRTLYRIRAVRDFGAVKAGDLGGFVESEKNLSHEGYSWVGGNAHVFENAFVGDNTIVEGNAWVGGNARVSGDAHVSDKATVCDNALVRGHAIVYDNARVAEFAHLKTNQDYLVVGPIGSRNDFTTFYKTRNREIYVKCGCFHGGVDAFELAVRKNHVDNRFAREYLTAIQLAKVHMEMRGTEE